MGIIIAVACTGIVVGYIAGAVYESRVGEQRYQTLWRTHTKTVKAFAEFEAETMVKALRGPRVSLSKNEDYEA